MSKENVKEQMDFDYPIIDRPSGRNRGIYYLEKIIVLLGTLVVWVVFVHHLHEMLVGEIYLAKTVDILLFFAEVFIVALLMVVGWTYYNVLAFGKLNRRKERPMLSDAKFSAVYGVTVEQLEELRAKKEVTVVDDEGGLAWQLDDGKARFSDSSNIEFVVPEE